MQWIFMLVGLILGGFAGESLVGALLGGLSGLALGQAVSLQNLAQQNERLRKQMSEFAERFERGTEVIHQRLLRVERQAQDLPESVPEPAAGIDQPLADTPPAPPAEVAPPLDWDIELPAVEAAPPPPRPPNPSSPSSVSRRSSLTPSQRRAVPPSSASTRTLAGRAWLRRGQGLAVRRQHGIAHRRGAAVHRPGLPPALCLGTGGGAGGVPLRRGGAGSDGAARRRLVAARAARRLRPDPARHRYRGAVPDHLRRHAPASADLPARRWPCWWW